GLEPVPRQEVERIIRESHREGVPILLGNSAVPKACLASPCARRSLLGGPFGGRGFLIQIKVAGGSADTVRQRDGVRDGRFAMPRARLPQEEWPVWTSSILRRK